MHERPDLIPPLVPQNKRLLIQCEEGEVSPLQQGLTVVQLSTDRIVPQQHSPEPRQNPGPNADPSPRLCDKCAEPNADSLYNSTPRRARGGRGTREETLSHGNDTNVP